MQTLTITFIIIGVVVIIGALIAIARIANANFKKNFYSQSIKNVKNMLDENEDLLREMSTKSADISSKGIEIKARAIKKGLSGEAMFCKHCGEQIDSDSKFCKQCGKEQ